MRIGLSIAVALRVAGFQESRDSQQTTSSADFLAI